MSKLFIIPTPVGNLKDITLRALETLKEIDLILAEDTRMTSRLLKHYEIDKPLKPYHQHNEHKVTAGITAEIKGGLVAALVSDAGTPCISDPGYLLVNECIKENIPVEALPGPTAFVPALVLSGFPADRFCFEGFLPHKKGRKTKLELFKEESRTIILYESPYRMLKLLEELKTYLGENVQLSVSRELTKLFEETVRGTPDEILTHFKTAPLKGEFVVVINNRK